MTTPVLWESDFGKSIGAAAHSLFRADVSTEFGDDSLKPALEALWSHLVDRNLYITGGFGPSAHNEGLTFDYDLPNDTAYAETCAAVPLVFWANRMLGLGPDRRYADVMEQALYNGALVGLSLDGTRFFYDNPLESRGAHHRWTWHRCPCCPPNIARLVASVGIYAHGVADAAVAVHLYCEGTADLTVAGRRLRLRQQTRYPADGQVTITLEPEAPTRFTLALRLPGWSPAVKVRVNGEAVPTDDAGPEGYLNPNWTWAAGDTIASDIAMPVETVHANPRLGADQGRVALQRGPLVYCLEQADNGAMLNALVLTRTSRMRCEPADDLGGVPALVGEGQRESWAETGTLYARERPKREAVPIRAVPYYAWDNRDPGEMLVWIRAEGLP